MWQELFVTLAAAGGPPADGLIDSRHMKAHRSAAGGKGGLLHAIGVSRGGRTSKLHALTAAKGAAPLPPDAATPAAAARS